MILIHQRHRQTDRRTDRQTDRRTDGQHAISIPRYALVHRAVKTMSSMLRSGKDQNNERSESNSTLWYNFPLNYLRVLQVVSTFRARSTVPTSAVRTTAARCSDNLEQLRQCALGTWHVWVHGKIPIVLGMQTAHEKGFLVFQTNWAVCSVLLVNKDV